MFFVFRSFYLFLMLFVASKLAFDLISGVGDKIRIVDKSVVGWVIIFGVFLRKLG